MDFNGARKPRRSAHQGFLVSKARWQSGHAAACKAVYAGSIPTLAFKDGTITRLYRKGAFFGVRALG
jgi:hypothetical protein